ncbi:MAG: hypothetical protein ACFFAS_13540 [Promethearchaeota archaeon]
MGGLKLINAKKSIFHKENQINEKLQITRTRMSPNHGVVQVEGNLMFAVNFKSMEWRFFDRLTNEWISISPSDSYYENYVIPILNYFQNSYPLNEHPTQISQEED